MGKPSLRQLAYEYIHAAIEDGRFPRGTVTSEGELSRMLDMSRTPIRAALQQLELEGYVRIAAKHGVIVLDSSSGRVGNLLELVGSMVLFAYSSSWITNREQLIRIASAKSEAFRMLEWGENEERKSLTDFEFDLLHDLARLSGNEEMIRTFRSAISRLFWSRNDRRWQAPFTREMIDGLGSFIDSLPAGTEAFTEALFVYLRILKRTWQ